LFKVIDLVGGTTVIGSGSKSGLTSGGFRIKETSNVIIKNLYFHNPPEGKDLIEIQYSSNVWVDHCDVSRPPTYTDYQVKDDE
jgi:pectate lyase